MGLQVWLSLNGTTRNQGLGGHSMSGSPASWSNGKMGSCATFTGSTSNVVYNNTSDLNYTDNFSFCLWLNHNYSGTTPQYAFTVGRADYGGYGYGVNPINTSQIQIHFGSGVYTVNCNANEWHHIAFTVGNNEARIYKDGDLYAIGSLGDKPTYSDGNGLGVGCFHYTEDIYAYIGSINDFRIYNHCLSLKEIKEIFKGLVCHYTLENSGLGNLNLSTMASRLPTLENAAGTSVWSVSTVEDKGVSCRKMVCTTSGTGGRYFTPFSNDVRDTSKTYTWSIDAKANKQLSTSLGLEGGGATNVTLNTVWTTYKVTCNLVNDTYSAFVIYPGGDASVDDWIEVKNFKIEEGTEATIWSPCSTDSEYSFWKDTIEEDYSGFNNRGTKFGNLSFSTESIRYSGCYIFDGDSTSIQLPDLSLISPLGEFTMNCWIYHDDTWSSKGYETIFGGPSGFELEAKNAGTNSPVLTAWNWGKGTATYELNKWNMITMVRTASDTKFYINAELKITGSAGTIPSGNYFIGAWNTATQQNFKGKISDFRLYNSALSLDNIKELYNNLLSLDKQGTPFVYSLIEG